MLWVPQTGFVLFLQNRSCDGFGVQDPIEAKTFSLRASWPETLLTSCCFFEGLAGEPGSGAQGGVTPGAAAAAPSQPVWALPAHRTPQLQPLPLPRVCVCVGAGGLGWWDSSDMGSRSDEGKRLPSSRLGERSPFPTFFLCTTQIFTVEVLIFYDTFTLHSPRVTGLKKLYFQRA